LSLITVVIEKFGGERNSVTGGEMDRRGLFGVPHGGKATNAAFCRLIVNLIDEAAPSAWVMTDSYDLRESGRENFRPIKPEQRS